MLGWRKLAYEKGSSGEHIAIFAGVGIARMRFLARETVDTGSGCEVGNGETGLRVAVNVYHHVGRTVNIRGLKTVGSTTNVLVL